MFVLLFESHDDPVSMSVIKWSQVVARPRFLTGVATIVTTLLTLPVVYQLVQLIVLRRYVWMDKLLLLGLLLFVLHGRVLDEAKTAALCRCSNHISMHKAILEWQRTEYCNIM